MLTYSDIANDISNIRYGEVGKIFFDFRGITLTIKEPSNLLLVGYDGASLYLAECYGFLLQTLE